MQCVGWQSGVALAHRHAVLLALGVQTAPPCLAAPWPPCSSRALCGTWLWGSMQVRSRRFDPKADLYSLSFIFAEVGGWVGGRAGGQGGGRARGRWVGGGCWAGCAGASSAQRCQLFHTSSSQQLSHPCATIHTLTNTACQTRQPRCLCLHRCLCRSGWWPRAQRWRPQTSSICWACTQTGDHAQCTGSTVSAMPRGIWH